MARGKVVGKTQVQVAPSVDDIDAAFASGESLETITGDGSKPLSGDKGKAGTTSPSPRQPKASSGDTYGHPRDKAFPWENYGPYAGHKTQCPKEVQTDVIDFCQKHTPPCVPYPVENDFRRAMQELAYEIAKVALHYMKDLKANKTSPIDPNDTCLFYAKRQQMHYWLRWVSGIGDERAEEYVSKLTRDYGATLYKLGVRFPPSWFGGAMTHG